MDQKTLAKFEQALQSAGILMVELSEQCPIVPNTAPEELDAICQRCPLAQIVRKHLNINQEYQTLEEQLSLSPCELLCGEESQK